MTSIKEEEVGEGLLEKVLELTGLPEELVRNELLTLIEGTGVGAENLTLEDLRAVLLTYLQQQMGH